MRDVNYLVVAVAAFAAGTVWHLALGRQYARRLRPNRTEALHQISTMIFFLTTILVGDNLSSCTTSQ